LTPLESLIDTSADAVALNAVTAAAAITGIAHRRMNLMEVIT
jgi:hypothetical protein